MNVMEIKDGTGRVTGYAIDPYSDPSEEFPRRRIIVTKDCRQDSCWVEATVNWSALGDVLPDEADGFAEGLREATAKARMLDERYPAGSKVC
jgi:hypothetical protein